MRFSKPALVRRVLALLTVALALLGISASSALAVDFSGTDLDVGVVDVGQSVTHQFSVTPSQTVELNYEDESFSGLHYAIPGGIYGPATPIPVTVTVTGESSPFPDHLETVYVLYAYESLAGTDFDSVQLTISWSVTPELTTPTPTPTPVPTPVPTPTPPPAGSALLQITGAPVDFGTVWLGDAPTKTVTVKNVGTADSDDLIARSFGPDSGEVEPRYARFSPLAPGDSVEVPITWAPETRGPLDAYVGISTLGGVPVGDVDLTGTAKAPVVKLSTTALKFGTVAKGKSVSKTVTVKNGGEGTIMFSRYPKITGADAPRFSWKGSTKGLKPGKSTTFTITLKPTAKGARKATLRFSPGSGPVALTGTGK